MLRSSDTMNAIRWQTLAIAFFLVIVAALLIQFFFLSEEIEDTRSRNAKLGIAEILAKQQQAKLHQASLSGTDDYELSQAAEQASQIAKNAGEQTASSNQAQQRQEIRSSPERKVLVLAVQEMSLVGVIRHDDYSVAIIKRQGLSEPQVFSEGEILANGVIVHKVLDDSVVVQSIKDKSVNLQLKISSSPLIDSNQASYNFLNLPSSSSQTKKE